MRLTQLDVRDWQTGDVINTIMWGATYVRHYGMPYDHVHRAGLHTLLVEAFEAVAPDGIRLNAACAGLENQSNRVTVQFADGRSETAGVAIGADVIHSVVRKQRELPLNHKECQMKIKRVEHVAIAVHDLLGSKNMLEETFGFNLELEEQIGSTKLAMYPVGETYLELLQTAEPGTDLADWIAEKGQSLFHICFEVEDIEGAVEELLQKGVKLLNETPRPGHGGSRIVFLDPQSTGNILFELAELPASH